MVRIVARWGMGLYYDVGIAFKGGKEGTRTRCNLPGIMSSSAG